MTTNYRSPRPPTKAAARIGVRRIRCEKDLETALVENLERLGIRFYRQLRTRCGVADVVTDDTVYEVKIALTLDALFKAVGQVTMYAHVLGIKRRVIIGYPVAGSEDAYAVVRALGIELNVMP